MSGVPARPPRRRPPRRRRVRPPAWLLLIVSLALVFIAGVALGEALHDNPRPGGTQTLVRTLTPLPLPPATVTVARP